MHRFVLTALSVKHPMERTAKLCRLRHRQKAAVPGHEKSNQPFVDVILDAEVLVTDHQNPIHDQQSLPRC